MRLSVIVCTYNPDPKTIGDCMASIRSALESVSDAEVIVVDNNSKVPAKETLTSQGIHFADCRFVRELEQGLTPARIRGIREAEGDLIVFVDDDNFVRADFFLNGMKLAEGHPFVGAFSGQVELVFEKEPPEWSKPYHGLLVRRRFERDVWSNLPNLDETMPCGAGLFVRRRVAEHYVRLHEDGKRGIQLDRKGASLFSGGDNDLAACACDVGLGVGLFHELMLDHYIPASRLEKDYLLRLTRGIYTSSVVFKSMRGQKPEPYTFGRRILDGIRLMFMNPLKRSFYLAQLRGMADGRRMMEHSRMG